MELEEHPLERNRNYDRNKHDAALDTPIGRAYAPATSSATGALLQHLQRSSSSSSRAASSRSSPSSQTHTLEFQFRFTFLAPNSWSFNDRTAIDNEIQAEFDRISHLNTDHCENMEWDVEEYMIGKDHGGIIPPRPSHSRPLRKGVGRGGIYDR